MRFLVKILKNLLCSPFVAILSSFLVAFGDACFNTQVYSILGGIYQNIYEVL